MFSRCMTRKLRSVEAEALAMMHTSFRSACSVKGHPPDSPKWEPTLTPARCHKRGTNTPNLGSKKLIFRVLNRPFETATKTTHESTGTKSRRACTPSRVTPSDEADQALQFQDPVPRDLCACLRKKRCQNIVAQSNFKSKWCSGSTSIVHVALWFFAFPIKAHVFSFLLGQTVQIEPGLLCDGRNAAATATRDASVAESVLQGSPRKFVCY